MPHNFDESKTPELFLAHESFARQASIPHSNTVAMYSTPGCFYSARFDDSGAPKNLPRPKFSVFIEDTFNPLPISPEPFGYVFTQADTHNKVYIKKVDNLFLNPVRWLNERNSYIPVSIFIFEMMCTLVTVVLFLNLGAIHRRRTSRS